MTEAEQKAVYEKFYRAAVPIVYAILRREEDELAWEIAGKGLMEMEGWLGEAELLTWFKTLARNECLQRLRTERRRGEVSIETLGEKDFSKLSVENSALGQIEWGELKFLKGEKELVEMVKEGYSWEEIGWTLGLSEGAAIKRWQRFVERLRRERDG